jgi:hypothetical protein
MKRRTSSALPVLYTQVRRVATAAKPAVSFVPSLTCRWSSHLHWKPTSAWDPEDSQVTPPAPNLNKWAKPAPTPRFPTPSPSKLPLRFSPTSPENQWGQPSAQGPSSSLLGRWKRPETSSVKRDDAQTSSNPRFNARLQSDAAQRARNTIHNLTPAALPRWRTHNIQQNNPQSSSSDPSHVPFSPRGNLTTNLAPSRVGRWARQDASSQPEQTPSQGYASTGVGENRDSRRLNRDEAPHKALSSPAQRSQGMDQRDKWGDISNASRNTSSQDPDAQEPKTGQNPTVKRRAREEDEEESALYANDVPASAGRGHKLGRDRTNFKTRGSIASHFREEGAAVPAYSRTGYDIKAKLGARREKERIRKAKSVKKVNVDVFIPSTVSVGQLARLLNVRMGEYHQFLLMDASLLTYIGLCRETTAEDGCLRNGGRVFT